MAEIAIVGGGLTHKAIQCFPFLLDNSYPKKLVHSVELISSEEHQATLEMPHPIVIYSRTVLNGMLLDRAQAAARRGCAQSTAPRNAGAAARRTGDDPGLLRAADGRCHHHQIPAALRRLYLVVPALRSSLGWDLREHVLAYEHGAAKPPERVCGEARDPNGWRQVLQPRLAVTQGTDAFGTERSGQELGSCRRCGRVGRSTYRRRAILCDSLRRIAGALARRGLPGEVSCVDQGHFFGRTRI